MLDGLNTPLELEGAELGPVAVAVTADRIRFYTDVTGDESARWTAEAPPGFASVLLFAVADLFLYHPAIIPFTATLLHLDQSFTYVGPMRADSEIVMSGMITRVRERGGSFFVTFESEGTDGGDVVVQSVSTFVLSDREAPAPDAPRVEPAARVRGEVSGSSRSASRHDLVRYSAATRDFNPLHWDHDTAVAAGLPGTVVHGLLMYAWMMQAASQSADGARITHAKVRFRTALFPGEQAELRAELDGSAVRIELVRGDEQLVVGTATVDATDR